MAEENQYNLGVQIGRLTLAVESLADRIAALETDMKSIQGFFARGKGAVALAFAVIVLAANGTIGALKSLKEWFS